MALVIPNGQPTPMQQSTYQNANNSQAYNQIGAAYEQYLGRPMNQADFYSQTNNGRDVAQKNITHAIGNIQNSDEARQYQQHLLAPPQKGETQVDQGNTQDNTQQYAPPETGGGGAPVPGVPQMYATPNFAAAAANAPQHTSQFKAQQIRDFTGKEIKAPEYTKTIFSQFTDPRNQQVQQGRNDLLLKQLQNPESMSQLWQDQMFESQKDQANSFAQQLGLQNQQQTVGRGLQLNGGFAQNQRTDVQNALMNQLLAGRRDIATQAATQNFADRMNVLGAAEAGLTNDVNREGAVFQNLLAGQQAQAGENQFGAQFGLAGQQAEAGNQRDNYAAYLSGRDLQDSSNARQEQFLQSAFGLNQQSRQNARQQALNEFLGLNNANLGWANYGLSADEQFLRYLGNY